jgi:hypothetical protein
MTGKHTNKKQLALSSVLILILIIAAYSIADKMMLPAPTPIERDWAGICVHSLSEDEAQLVSESGAGWVRIDVSENFGVAVTNAKAYNLKVLGILDSWMFNDSTTFTPEEWRDAVTHYVSNYSDDVDAWEIWNEPANPKQNWTLLNLNISSPENMSKIVQFYFSMVQIASPIIRHYDPTAKILLFGGLTLWSGNASNLALDKEFALQLAALNIKQYGDAISVHAYPWTEKVEPSIWEKYDQSLDYYKGLFNMEIWVTETGYAVGSEGESGQAYYMSDALQYFNGKVAKFFWYSLLDNAWDGQSFGLIGNGTTPRLAYYELQKHLIG